ncbi:hypothetical protein, partial [Catenibacterium sp.]|uniref:hypothetical protein n=1 Tax=Catenibacterium sp. TaxID=2049022 RepID=UPI003AF14418
VVDVVFALFHNSLPPKKTHLLKRARNELIFISSRTISINCQQFNEKNKKTSLILKSKRFLAFARLT